MPLPASVYRWRPHPWHGLDAGAGAPRVVNAYIEITPFDSIKYEVDKISGYLRVDRPQRSSSLPPTLYGFVPQTYCGRRVGQHMPGAEHGDRDPLDICVISERAIDRAEVILPARVIGGLPMLDKGEADDKIIAVLDSDYLWSQVEDIADLPPVLIERLRHYFETYKLVPGGPPVVSIAAAYGRDHAETVIRAAIEDYRAEFGAAEKPPAE
ncbi:MAG TPA: inorganic pyrophosphatase [Terriglobales bacterium]|nr:inorganic pyrophosphatase [Terriglobales bacterium]